jgi:predicted anti-sigma-YlaC factor YlaD
MSCHHYEEQISCLLDDELAIEQHAELFGHLVECPECRSFLSAMLNYRGAIRRDEIPFPIELDCTILKPHSRLALEKIAAWWRRPIAHSRLAVAAAALLVVAGTAVVTRMSRPAPAARFQVLYALPAIEIYADDSGTMNADSLNSDHVLR